MEAENSTHREPTPERRLARPRIVVAGFVVLAVITVLAGSACADSAADSFEAQVSSTPDTYYAQWPRGGTPRIPDVTGVIELLLFDSGGGQAMFRATVEAEGDGLVDNALYSLWLAGQEGQLVQIDSGRADEECEVDSDTGKEGDECEIVLDLFGQVQVAPFEVTTLLGLTATVREGLGNIGTLELAPVVLSFTVTEADL